MAEKWAERLLEYSSGATATLCLAVGHEVGIFKVMSDAEDSITSQDIADKANLKERYVREWLGCMTACEAVEVTGDDPPKYYIPESHKQFLRTIGISSSLFANYATRYDAVKACFHKDGPSGVGHENFPGIFSVFNEMRVVSQKKNMEDELLPAISELLPKLESGIDIAEIGCGTGILSRSLAEKFPNSRVHGSDISDQALSMAREGSAAKNLENVTFEKVDICNIPDTMVAKFDLIVCFDVIHDLNDPEKALKEIRRALKDGGYFVMADIHTKKERTDIVGDMGACSLYGMSTFLCLPASLEQNGGIGLGAAWSRELAGELIKNAGLKLIRVNPSKQSSCLFYHVCVKN
ncbi:S-adenosylmethionine-dependent methyltransferase Rv2258c-like [Haliotis cracherodii]|uniref:S-adenosylmethionine-dependent methyltransferase Rv2258c-like n=1 Tax=Haliotis cracherodii TaxID=6455 RepID=UPI0039EB7B40